MSKAGKALIEAAREALAITRGEAKAASITIFDDNGNRILHVKDAYLHEAEAQARDAQT